MLRHLPIIGIFGSGAKLTAERAALARDIGILAARLGSHLLAGASHAVTESAAEGFVSIEKRRGVCIGTLPRAVTSAFDRPRVAGDEATLFPNRHIELAIYTTLSPQTTGSDSPERHKVNLISCNAVVALPGSVGTHDELQMAASVNGEAAKKPQERRTILVGPAEEFSRELKSLFQHVPTIAEAESHICRVLSGQGFLVDRLVR